jgi:tricorn protease
MKFMNLTAALVMTFTCVTVAADDAHLMRWADIHGDVIVFTYEDDLWLVASDGGEARRLTRHEGGERYAKFSPDGAKLAFIGSYDGGTDVYVMDARGGVPERLTWHPSRERVLGWTPDGSEILFMADRQAPFRAGELYAVAAAGGHPRRLPLDRCGLLAMAPDGDRIVFNRINRQDRTWKRHQGGTAQDLWLGSLAARDHRRITEWEGTDTFPMWIGDAVYFASDREFGTLNLYRMDPASGEITALTTFSDYDVKNPSAGPGAIVFQYGEKLHVLDTETGGVRFVPISIRSDRVTVRPRLVTAGRHPGSFRPSPEGSSLLLEDRGELLLLPAEEGDPVNLTETPGVREKDGVFSPNGEHIAYVSDRTGEEELWVMSADGTDARRLTEDGRGFRFRPVWSPDSGFVVFADKSLRLNLVEVASGEVTEVDRGLFDDAWYRWGIQDYAFSPDSSWLAYTVVEESLNDSIFLYEIATGTRVRVTGPETRDWSPSFSADGKYLYFLSDRTLAPIMGRMDQNHIFVNMTRPYVTLLAAATKSPFAPGDADADAEADVVTVVDAEGLGRRTLVAEGIEAGDYDRLEATASGFVFLQRTEQPFLKYQQVTDRGGESLVLWGYDLSTGEASTLMEGIIQFHVAADGEHLAYKAGRKYGIVGATSPSKVGDGSVDVGAMKLRVDRLAEFEQIFDEAWRVQRDFFYDPGMHGVDWEATRDKYRRFLPDCGNRADLTYLIGEMIGELNAGHTYVYGGDSDGGGASVRVGLLGADFSVDEGAAHPRIARIVPGNHWHPSERSPLEEPGCTIAEGDYLIAVDGREVANGDNVYAHLEDRAGEWITVTTNGTSSTEGASECRVKTLGSESGLRYRAWVDDRRRVVDELSGGTIGYLHLPNMMDAGLVEFARGWYHAFTKKGFVIDDRYNSGGFVGDQIIDRLEREIWSFTQPREGGPIPNPERSFGGHLVVLVNHDTGSNGEYFAEAMKIKGLAPVMGTRTWGGAIGIEPHQNLVDGGVTTPPQFAPYGLDGTWLIEGRGVEPDTVVENLPPQVLAGADPQLEAAVEYLMTRIAEEPVEVPPHPPFPDKSK